MEIMRENRSNGWVQRVADVQLGGDPNVQFPSTISAKCGQVTQSIWKSPILFQCSRMSEHQRTVPFVLVRLMIKLFVVGCSSELVICNNGILMIWWHSRTGRLVLQDQQWFVHRVCTWQSARWCTSSGVLWTTYAESVHVVIFFVIHKCIRIEWSRAKDSRPILERCKENSSESIATINSLVLTIDGKLVGHSGGGVKSHSSVVLMIQDIKKDKKINQNGTDVRFIWKVDCRTVRWDLWNKYN